MGLLFVSSCKPRPRRFVNPERPTTCFPLLWFLFFPSNLPQNQRVQIWYFHDAKRQLNPGEFPCFQKSPASLLRYLDEHTNGPTRNAPPMILRGHYLNKTPRRPRTIGSRVCSLRSIKNGSPNNHGLFPIPLLLQ